MTDTAQPGALDPTLVAPASNVPDRIGPYRIIGEIGRGGMGAVLRAVRDDDQLKKHVALKLIKKGLDTEDLLTRFRLEKQILGSLNHPNIARILDAGATEDGRPYFVMEHIEGQPITDYCDTQQLSTQERLELFRKVCSAVHAAHQNLIVHRDIKPSNILVTTAGEPKLLDFGIAKLLNADLMGSPLATLPTERLMTPEYASPEQVQGLPITTASDVYSLGVLLYEILTGRQPYQLKSRVHDELVRVVCEVEPERPSTAVTRPAEVVTRDGTTRTFSADEIAKRRASPASRLKRTLSGDLDNIVLMAMRKSPRRRYASAQELADDLVHHIEGRPVKARSETVGYVLAKFLKRNKAQVAAAAVVLLAVSAGGVSAAWWAGQAREQERQRIAAEAEAARRLGQLREFASSFLTRLNGSILRLDGSTTAQLLLANTAVEVLDRLAAEPAGQDDPQLQAGLARGYRELGSVRGGSRGGTQQDAAGAADCFQKAMAAWAKVGDPSSLDADSLVDWCHLRLDMALLDYQRGRNDSALAHTDAVLAAAPRLAGDTAGYAALRIEPWAQFTRSDILLAMGREAESTQALDRSLGRRRELLGLFEGRADARRDVAVATLRKAEQHLESGEMDAAADLAMQALSLREALAAESEHNSSFQRDLAVTRGFIADVWSARSDYARAASWEEKAAPVFTLLAARDPDNARAAQDAWYSQGKLVHLLFFSGEHTKAEAAVPAYREAAARWLRMDKVSSSRRRHLATQLRDVGLAALNARRLPAARACLRDALELCRRYSIQGDDFDDRSIEALLGQIAPGDPVDGT